MEAIRLVLAVLAVIFVGWNVLYLVSHKSNRLSFLERLSLSLGIGFGAISFWMFLLYFFGAKFGAAQISAPWVILFIVNVFIRAKSGKIAFDATRQIKNPGNAALKIFLAAGILFEVLYVLFRALIKPIEAYDAIATFAIKSKIFFIAKCIPSDYFFNTGNFFPHLDYPLNVPLSETLLYLSMGGLNEQLVKLIFPLYFIAILGVLYFGIRRFAGSTYALLFTFVLASIPQFSNFATNAYTEVTLSYYYLTATLFLFYWFKEREAVEFLYISAIMTALAGWTKNEGLAYCLINIFVLSIFLLSDKKSLKSKDFIRGISYVFAIAMMLLPWLIVRKTAHVVNSDFGVLDANKFDIIKKSKEIIPMFYEFQRQIFGPKKWNIFWVVFLSALIIYWKKAFSRYQVYIMMPLVFIMASYILAYLLTQTTMPSLWSRLMIHFLPIAVYLLAVLLKDEAPHLLQDAGK